MNRGGSLSRRQDEKLRDIHMWRLIERGSEAVGDGLHGQIPGIAGIERLGLRFVAGVPDLGELTTHEAGENLRDSDPAEVVEAKRLTEAVNREFARDVSSASRISGGAGVRADVDDMTFLPLEHSGDDSVSDPDHARHVRLDRGQPVLDRLLTEDGATA